MFEVDRLRNNEFSVLSRFLIIFKQNFQSGVKVSIGRLAHKYLQVSGVTPGVPQDGCKTFPWRQIIHPLQKKSPSMASNLYACILPCF